MQRSSTNKVNFTVQKHTMAEAEIPLKVISTFKPSGDQPQAIKKIVAGLNAGEKDQVLLGVTGSGKTYTIAKAIQEVNRPALILAPN